jgi:hypothetical protein
MVTCGALLILFCLACTREPVDGKKSQADLHIVYHGVTITDDTPANRRPVSLSVSRIATQIKAALRARGVQPLHDMENPSKAWKIRMRGRLIYGVHVPQGLAEKAVAGQAKLVFKMEVSIRPPQSSESMHQIYEYSTGARTKSGAAALKSVLSRLATATSRSAVKWVMRRVQFLGQAPHVLLTGLDSKERGRRLAAIERLAMLKYKPAVPFIVRLLQSETDSGLRHRLVGALAEIGDDSAARALIDVADTKDRDMLRAILQALSIVGGERVSEFFDILSMHDAADIRDMVESAQRRLKRRSKKSILP